MATRFGGTHSPGGDPRTGGPAAARRLRPARFGARLNLLFAAPFAVLLPGFWQDPLGLAQHIAAFALMMGAAWLTREGVRAEDAWAARAVARRPAFPRKLFGAALMGLGIGLAAAPPAGSLIAALLLGGIGAILHGLAFGADPMRDKGANHGDLFQTDRVARVVDEAESYLAEMRAAIASTGDRKLLDRVDAFAATAREMCRRVEDDPRDLTGVRRYLGVYLMGARDASRKYADIHARGRDPGARSDYEALLSDLERSFAARTERLMLDDKTDLGIEIEVLRERLQREGVLTGQQDGLRKDQT